MGAQDGINEQTDPIFIRIPVRGTGEKESAQSSSMKMTN